MPGVTLKVSPQTRDRVRALAARANRSMHAIIDEALELYESSLAVEEYLEGWRRFQADQPEAFADYMQESAEIENGLTDPLHG